MGVLNDRNLICNQLIIQIIYLVINIKISSYNFSNLSIYLFIIVLFILTSICYLFSYDLFF